MALVHVYPVAEEADHDLDRGADCWCEPTVIDEDLDPMGQHNRVFVHRTHMALADRSDGWHPPRRHRFGG